MATLYEMQQSAQELYELLQAGEIDEQTMADTIEAMMVPEKLESYCQVLRQMAVDADAYKAEKDRFAEKEKAARNAADRLKARMADFLQATGQKKIDCGLFTVRQTKGESVTLVKEELIPAEYYDEQAPKLSRARIKAALKAGEIVPGAGLTVTYGVSIK